jgi:cell division protein FtsW (lipid II flippase)
MCNTNNCPTGIATQKEELRQRLDIEKSARQLFNYFQASAELMQVGRLLAGSLVCTFFVYAFVNIGMVIGVLPVVGIPLPLISYGGTSMVTLFAGFGIPTSGYRKISTATI